MVLLVIDSQSGITNEKLGFFNRFISNVEKLISVARQNNVEVIYVRHDDGEGAALHRGNPEYAECVTMDEALGLIER